MEKKGCALITGASRGIGYEVAKEFAMAGYDVVLVARSREALDVLGAQLQEAYNSRVWILAVDLARAEAPQQVEDFLKQKGLVIDVLVNNAGLGSYGLFVDSDVSTIEQMLQVNMSALTHLTRRLLPGMLARKRGRILNMASTAGFQPGPLMAVYYATKAYVLSFSQALANELAGTGITVTAYCPGPTESGFQKAAALEGSGLFAHRKIPTSAEVARDAFRATMQGKVVAIHGGVNWVMAQATRIAPRKMVTKVVRFIQEKR